MMRLTIASVVLHLLVLAGSQPVSAGDCFSVIVGKDASVNGHVMFAHTEDFAPPRPISLRKVPRRMATANATSGAGPAITEWSRLLTEVEVEEFSDCIMNEWGVVVASNQCPSRLTDTVDGIGKGLRHRITARATSAREAVLLAGEIVASEGYKSNGRTYFICDPREGWAFSVIGGKHWLAHRIADDEVAAFPNSFTIQDVDFDDSASFLASEGLVEYAESRGWYDPDTTGVFDFARTFADPEVAAGSFNVCRQWTALRYLTSDTVRANWNNLPFAMSPDHKLDVEDLMAIMRDHYEHTKVQILPTDSSNPHANRFMTVCSPITQMSFIAELRDDLPRDVGLVYWLCLGKPCESFYVPFYFGVTDIPVAYSEETVETFHAGYDSLDTHKSFTASDNAYLNGLNYCRYVDSNYARVSSEAAAAVAAYHTELMKARGAVEHKFIELYPEDSVRALGQLGEFAARKYQEAVNSMIQVSSN